MNISPYRISIYITLVGLVIFASALFAKPFTVKTEIQIKTDDWFPLTIENMKAAATDTALAELSKGGIFSIDSKSSESDSLRLEISLIGPAETAKLTIHANLTGQPTYVSTASISLSGMDYQGIYKAFEHIGTTAAQRMNDRIEALVVFQRKPVIATAGPVSEELRSKYNMAQKLKRQFQYKEARIIFEQLSASSIEGAEKITELSKDELRYGLPIFEAKQQTVSDAFSSGKVGRMVKAISRAENLYRQILAENENNMNRTMEAQKALDDLSVTSSAIKTSVKAQSLTTAYSLSRMMENQIMRGQLIGISRQANYDGGCPGKSALEKLTRNISASLSLKNISEKNKAVTYSIYDERSDYNFSLLCLNHRVSIVN